ncbi:aminopeptidase P family protein [Sporosarcina sp. BI001-red]|uniref:M24 family metallopeptidase n=1 Tax=Sporosarcina sp. BI001-red TaxID=2282866 RepID=UPI000E27CF94|nr:Xaa-Pro peptidase family protein [Sporosarcina sp. BI001-red]REB06548.1 aminopeptidase P family protein [Sporosarcina sp. BI001-red]
MTKLKMIQQYLQDNNVEAAFVTTPDNVFYLSGFSSDPHERLLGVMIFKDAEPFIVCPLMEVPDVKSAGWTFGTVGYEDTDDAWEFVQAEVKRKVSELSSIAIEKSHLTVERLERMGELFPSAQFSRLDEQLNTMRSHKDASELQLLREAAALADYAIEVACENIVEGITELELQTAIELALKKKGVQKMSFDTTVLSGPKTASPHGTPGERKIQKGDFVLMDLGVVHKGYCSDITRTVSFGEPSAEQLSIYEAVRFANQAAIDLVKPGVRASELDRAAREVITKAGYGEYFTHRLGHGLGISVHEFPSIHGTNDFQLEEGMVFTIEPGIYNSAITGVRIEDDVVVTADGIEVLTKFPKELKIIK